MAETTPPNYAEGPLGRNIARLIGGALALATTYIAGPQVYRWLSPEHKHSDHPAEITQTAPWQNQLMHQVQVTHPGFADLKDFTVSTNGETFTFSLDEPTLPDLHCRGHYSAEEPVAPIGQISCTTQVRLASHP